MDAYCTLVVWCVVCRCPCHAVQVVQMQHQMGLVRIYVHSLCSHTHSLLIHTPLGMEVIRDFLLVKHFENVNVVKHTVESSPLHQLLLRAYLGSKRI